MADTLELEIVTPDKLLVKEPADEVQIPGKAGDIGVLPGHAPLITELTIGEIAYKHSGKTEHLSVAWGFAEVLPDNIPMLRVFEKSGLPLTTKREPEVVHVRLDLG